MKITRLSAFALIALPLHLGGCQQGAPEPRRWEFETMGTRAALEIHGKTVKDEPGAQAQVREIFDMVDACMSTWDPASEISRLNRAPADSALTLSPLLGHCLGMAIDLRERSGGAFEPGAEILMRLWGFYRRQGHLPTKSELDRLLPQIGAYHYEPIARRFIKHREEASIDLGGIAKGYALDLAVRALRDHGVASALLDLGGNLYCLGEAGPGRPWRVGIRDPEDRNRLFASLALSDAAVATSGSYERFVSIDGRRFGHIMNPATGRPAEGLLSASVIHAEAALGDGLATALFVLGPEKAEALLADYPEVKAILVLPGESGEKARVRATQALEGDLEILPEYLDRYALVFF